MMEVTPAAQIAPYVAAALGMVVGPALLPAAPLLMFVGLFAGVAVF